MTKISYHRSRLSRLHFNRAVLYLVALMAIVLDWGSTVIVTLQRGRFDELNPIARMMGFEGSVLYAIGIMAVMSIVLFKWGLDYQKHRDRKVIPFAFLHDRNEDLMRSEIEKLARALGTTGGLVGSSATSPRRPRTHS